MPQAPVPAWRRLMPAFLLLAAVIAAVLLFTRLLGAKADAEALSLAERAIRRAAVECYALEGAYPTDLDHLADAYGVSVDENRFIVHYQYVASNLMPVITVLPAP